MRTAFLINTILTRIRKKAGRMSSEAYNEEWLLAQEDTNALLESEFPQQEPKPEKDRGRMLRQFTTMYLKYVQVFRRLENCYDQVFHPQKRRLLRTTLEATIGRILELKHEMMGLDFSEYHYFDEMLLIMKLIPQDIELPIPKFFREDTLNEFREREKLLGSIIAQIGPLDLDGEHGKSILLSKEEAVRLLKVHERARQGRVRLSLMKEIRAREERERLAASEKSQMPPAQAAVQIQRMWKGYITRKKTQEMRKRELEFIGMVPPKRDLTKPSLTSQIAKMENKRKATQHQYEKDYIEALDSVKERLKETEGPDIKEQMMDQIRQWFIDVRDSTGKFPEYPDGEDGGSTKIFKEQAIGEEPEESEAKGKGKKGKGKKGKDKDKKEKKEKKKPKEKKGKKGGEDEPDGFVMKPSNFAPELKSTATEYAGVWQGRDESSNFAQKHDLELIKEQKRVEVEGEIRVHVDELMREELKNLKFAVEKDKGGKGKKAKAKGKKGKGKKGKGGKKGKKEKDLTPDRTIESLYEELAQQGIVTKYPKVRLSQYIGNINYLASTLREMNHEPMPSLGEVRRVVTEYCILPMGSQVVHEGSPHIKSVMLGGPVGTGKKTLLYSICTETQANLFDISPVNLVGKYQGKQATTLLVHMVWKVARAMPPSVIWIGDCERTFMKKVPKTDPTDPKRLKKDLTKSIKLLKPEHRVLIVGTSKSPFDAEVKLFCGFYQRLILLPRPDYASRLDVWKYFVEKFKGRMSDPQLDYTTLARVSDGFTPGHFSFALKTVLTDRRLAQMHRRPLTPGELVAPLSKVQHIDVAQEQQFKEWYAKTPLGKKRTKLAKGDDEEGGGEKKGKGKKGKKGKKK